MTRPTRFLFRRAADLARGVALLLAALTAALALSGCAGSMGRGPALSPAEERQLGASLDPELMAQFGGRYPDARLEALVRELGLRVASGSAEAGQPVWTYKVLDTPTPNAFSLPGGFIYVTRGLLAVVNSDDELAGVLAHEMGHVVGHHYEQRVLANRRAFSAAIVAGRSAAAVGADEASQYEAAAVAWLDYLSSFSREQENEADLWSVRAMARAGFDPNGFVAFLATLERMEALETLDVGDFGAGRRFSTHPASAARRNAVFAAAIAAQARLEAGGAAPRPSSRGGDDLLGAVDGMLYGHAPAQGFVRGRSFLHPTLRVRFDAPPDFQLLNGADAVTIVGPDRLAAAFFGAEARYDGPMTAYLQELSDEAAADGDPPLRQIERFSAGGLDAASATARPGQPEAGEPELRIYAINAGDRIYHFIGFYPHEMAASARAKFDAMAQSFRQISAAAARRLKPRWIKVVEVGRGDSVATLSRRMAVDGQREETFRMLNGLGPTDGLAPGQRVKIVIER